MGSNSSEASGSRAAVAATTDLDLANQEGNHGTDLTATRNLYYINKWKENIIKNRKKQDLFLSGLVCSIRVKLNAKGKLDLVKIEKSSGNRSYDYFAEQAIYRSEPFEMPTDPDLNKELTEMEHIFDFEFNAFN